MYHPFSVCAPEALVLHVARCTHQRFLVLHSQQAHGSLQRHLWSPVLRPAAWKHTFTLRSDVRTEQGRFKQFLTVLRCSVSAEWAVPRPPASLCPPPCWTPTAGMNSVCGAAGRSSAAEPTTPARPHQAWGHFVPAPHVCPV